MFSGNLPNYTWFDAGGDAWRKDTKLLPDTIRTALTPFKRSFGAHRMLLMEGDTCPNVFVVLSGWLGQSKSLEGGQSQIIDFSLPGDIVDPVAADGKTSAVTIETLTDVSLAMVPYTTWDQLTKEHESLHVLDHLEMAARQARQFERTLRLGKGTAETRIAFALLELCIRIGSCCDDSPQTFHIPLTQQQLGDFVGLSSVHVCRTLRRLVRNDVIEMQDHIDIRVLDVGILEQLAGIDHETLRTAIIPHATKDKA